MSPGHIGSAKFDLSNQPTDSDQVTIGADTYMFLDDGSSSLDDTSKIAVLIGADVSETKANLIAAINAEDDDNVHDSLYVGGDSSSPALANGTENVFADDVNDFVRIRNADAPGGNVKVGTQDIPLSATMTNPASIWNQENLSVTGKELPGRIAMGNVVVDSTNQTQRFNIELPFTPVDFTWNVYDADGVLYPEPLCSVVIDGDSLLVDFAAGVPPIDTGSVMRWQAVG